MPGRTLRDAYLRIFHKSGGIGATMSNSAAQMELAKAYRRELDRFYSFETAVVQIVEEDLPDGTRPEAVTGWHLQTLRDLTNRLSALVEGWRGGGA